MNQNTNITSLPTLKQLQVINMTTKHGESAALDDKTLRLFAADCAEHVLPLFEAEYPDDDRPRKAIEAARAYARGEIDDASMAASMDAARDAARAASSAASDTSWAASWSASDAAWAAERAAARDAAWDAAWAASRAASWAASSDASSDASRAASRAASREWQGKHLLEMLRGDAL